MKLDRRLNVIVYLNPNWKEDYGGHLEFWDKKMKAPIKKILPIFNRLAIFSTNDFTNHGHPEALSCPEDMSRKSLALFYFIARYLVVDYGSSRRKSSKRLCDQR